jgi:hypothetical protein
MRCNEDVRRRWKKQHRHLSVGATSAASGRIASADCKPADSASRAASKSTRSKWWCLKRGHTVAGELFGQMAGDFPDC